MTQSTQSPANLPTVVDEIRSNLGKMAPQFKAVLPSSISPEKFARVLLNAIQRTPTLLRCDRRSLFLAALSAAEDGLLCDGREGVIIPFRDGDASGGGKENRAVWIPMIHGIRKKIRQSGEIIDMRVEAVFEGDVFQFQKGDDPHIEHIPDQSPGAGRSRNLTHVYSIVKMKDGTLNRDVMSVAEIEEIRRRYARSQKGPWGDAMAYSEMAKKTVFRHHAKVLPTNSDIDRVLSRDDALFDVERARSVSPEVAAARVANIKDAFDRFGAGTADETQSDGERQEQGSSPSTLAAPAPAEAGAPSSGAPEH